MYENLKHVGIQVPFGFAVDHAAIVSIMKNSQKRMKLGLNFHYLELQFLMKRDSLTGCLR